MKPLHYEIIYRMLLERFGEPIGNAPATAGVPDEREDAEAPCYDQYGMMQTELDDESNNCCQDEQELDEKTPPGGEKVVKALKKDKRVKNPWAVAWSMKNKGEI